MNDFIAICFTAICVAAALLYVKACQILKRSRNGA